jgi:hypothetical protein
MNYETNSIDNLTNLIDLNQLENYNYNFDQTSRISTKYNLVATIVWTFISFIALLGNGLVIFTIIKYKKFSDVTQCFLFNLAISDISFVLFCIPVTSVIYLTEYWIFGRLLCILSHYLSSVSLIYLKTFEF